MPRFLCNMINEIVILSDGRVTTCCHDARGLNAYASIISDNFDQVVEKYLQARKRLVDDALSLKQCAECYRYYLPTGNGGMNFDPTDDEAEAFLKSGEACSKYSFVVEPTVKCNLRCTGCPTNTVKLSQYRSVPFIDFDQLQLWLTGFASKVQKIRFYNYGESFLHPHAIDFLDFANRNLSGVDIDVATNGLLLSTREQRIRLVKSNVGTIHVSIHGSNQRNIEKYMSDRYSFNNIIEILHDIVRIKREMNTARPYLIWKYILFEWNDSEEDILEAKALAKAIGVDRICFELAAHPVLSRRFGNGNEEWKKFTAGMEIPAYNCGKTAYWDARCPDWDTIKKSSDVLKRIRRANKGNCFLSRILKLMRAG